MEDDFVDYLMENHGLLGTIAAMITILFCVLFFLALVIWSCGMIFILPVIYTAWMYFRYKEKSKDEATN